MYVAFWVIRTQIQMNLGVAFNYKDFLSLKDGSEDRHFGNVNSKHFFLVWKWYHLKQL